MDYNTPGSVVGDRLRTERVARRLESGKYGQTTRHYHRVQQVQQVSFLILLVLAALAGLFLLSA